MTLLSRKTSSKSLLDRDSRGRPDGQGDNPADRAQSEGKPSLLQRLRKSSSRSRERDDQPPNQSEHPVSPHGARQIEKVGDKVPAPKVTEVLPHVGQGASQTQPANVTSPTTLAKLSSPLTKPDDKTGRITDSDHHHKSHKRDGLTKDDVEHLFSGAPQFVLEKGRRGRFFPQAFFPWNNDLEISDLQDRRYLKHESFALSTLHAHLPIPDEVNWRPGLEPPVKKEGLELGKRPMFELGIYERPNMLSLDGREPGTIGMRYFLERPVGDGMTDEKVKEHGKDIEIDLAIANAPAMEAFKMLALSKDNAELNAKIGKHAPAVERSKLLRDGPHSWKAVGVRDISIETLAKRMDVISYLRDQVLNAGWRETVLNHLDTAELYSYLFNELLYPPRKIPSETKHEKASLKIQIEALVKVLTTPGAWLDLSVPEARLRFGKILHKRSTRYDQAAGLFIIDPERKWLLIQLLLSVELVVRLDAALRLGIALHSENFEVSSEEIHHFNKLRNLKVDWDLVAARRYLFLSYVKKIERKAPAATPQSPQLERPSHLRQTSSATQHDQHHGGFFGALRHRMGLESPGENADPLHLFDTCDVAIMPRQPGVMIDGLSRFATTLTWPRSEELIALLNQKLCTPNPEDREKLLMDAIGCSEGEIPEPKPDNLTTSLQSFNVNLHAATPSTIGGWLSHSWLSGLILPGTSICDILMSTLLENDPDPQTLRDLGSKNLPLRASGFILNGSSWWSKSSIMGRVLAPMHGAKESMGWVSTPRFVPLHENTLQPVSNRWVKIKTFPVPTARQRPRIFDGDKLAEESTPLGKGKGGIMGSEFSMVTDHVFDKQNSTTPDVTIKDIKVHLSTSDLTEASSERPLSAWAQFDLSLATTPSTADNSVSASVSKQVRYGLNRAVYFVTSHPCRPPHGHATFKSGTLDFEHGQEHPHHTRGVAEHIPAHPLHKTYKFVTKTLADLASNPHAVPPDPSLASAHEEGVWIIDARGHYHPSTPARPLTPSVSSASTTTTSSATVAGGLASPTPSEIGGYSLEKHLYGSSDPQLWRKDILVRAWCAENGRNAIIARVGRTCLSCAIREARALEIGIIIRVGVGQVPI